MVSLGTLAGRLIHHQRCLAPAASTHSPIPGNSAHSGMYLTRRPRGCKGETWRCRSFPPIWALGLGPAGVGLRGPAHSLIDVPAIFCPSTGFVRLEKGEVPRYDSGVSRL